ncbi:MAG: MFS transporter [Actinomycetota bacterium]
MLHRALDESIPADVRHRVTVLTLARTAANGCFRFAPPFLATIAHGNGTDLAGIGIAVAVSELSGLLSPFNGEIVERLHRRTAMATGLAGVGLGTLLAASSVNPVMFTVALVIIAQGKVMFDLGLGAWTSDRVPFAQRGQVMGLIEISWALGLLVGVSTMGLVTAITNWRAGYALGAVGVMALAAIVARSIPIDSGAHTAADRPARGRVRVASVAPLMLAMFSLMAASQALFVTFGSYLEDTFGFTPATLSAMAFGLGFGELFSSLLSSRRADHWGKERSAAIGGAMMVPAALALAIGHDHMWAALPALVVAIAAFEFAIVSAIPLGTAAIAGSPARGMALMLGAGTFGRALCSVTATRLYDARGMAYPALLCAGFASCTTLAYTVLHRRQARAS